MGRYAEPDLIYGNLDGADLVALDVMNAEAELEVALRGNGDPGVSWAEAPV